MPSRATLLRTMPGWTRPSETEAAELFSFTGKAMLVYCLAVGLLLGFWRVRLLASLAGLARLALACLLRLRGPPRLGLALWGSGAWCCVARVARLARVLRVARFARGAGFARFPLLVRLDICVL